MVFFVVDNVVLNGVCWYNGFVFVGSLIEWFCGVELIVNEWVFDFMMVLDIFVF